MSVTWTGGRGARWWRWSPRRCVVCRDWLPSCRWRLGLRVCTGECFRVYYARPVP